MIMFNVLVCGVLLFIVGGIRKLKCTNAKRRVKAKE